MKTIFSFLVIFISLTAMSQNKFAKDWQQVDSLTNLGQSQSALDLANRIYEQSKAVNQADQFVKACLYRMRLEADYQEDYYVKIITGTQAEIQSAQAPVKQILYSILAELYWRYYENNRWQIQGRSETSKAVSDDIRTWDLKKLVSACLENYTLSLGDKALLKNTQLSVFDEIVIKQEGTRKLRPTLFDFLAHRAIDFFANEEAGLTKPAVTFLVDNPDFFASSAQFAALSVKTQDEFSFDYQALKLYQEVVGFHLKDKDPSALVDAELERFAFVHEKSTLPEKDSLYLEALRKLESRYLDHPVSTEVAFEIASQLNGENEDGDIYPEDSEFQKTLPDAHKWDRKKAVEVCKAAISRFPDSFGAKNCKVLIANIKKPAFHLTTEYASIPEKPSLALVNYKNVQRIFFRLLKTDPATEMELREIGEKERIERYLKIEPEKTWEQPLPDDGDFNNHSAEIRLPAMPVGYYVLLACNQESFLDSLAVVTVSHFWQTNISYLSSRIEDGKNEIYILDRSGGQPLEGVKVQVFYREYNQRARKYDRIAGGEFVSDKSGLVSIPVQKENEWNCQFSVVFSKGSDKLATENYFYSFYNQKQEPKSIIRTNFFTDRSIYRPGQTIYFKGIVLESKGEEVKIKPGFSTEVALHDVNGKVVSKLQLTTNDFGSFSGSFTAPQGVLTGEMNIRCATGLVSVQVEEYKRPKFEVLFEPVKGSYRLGESITVKGKAAAYAGSMVSDAKVTYRVVRNARFPDYWWFWRGMQPESPEMEITSGETVTDSDGSFTLQFKAIPDLSVERELEPIFNYTIYADVADMNGETHNSETAISVGYKALLVKTDLPDEVNLEKDLQFSFGTTNLNGEKEPASGNISIAKLRQPGQIYFSRKWTKPDQFTMTKEEFEKDFPGEVYDNEDDISTWPKEAPVFIANFNTPADSVIKVGNKLSAGMYLLEINTRDAFGEAVVYKKYFTAFDPLATKTEAVSPSFFTLLTPKALPGEEVKFILATPLKKVTILYEIVQDEKVVSREFLSLNKEQMLFSIPVKEEYRGNFGINLCFVKNNCSFLVSRVVNVPYPDKKLDIRFATFRNKLLPGQEEEWQLTLSDSKGEKAAAELLAGMYDASLDVFRPHNWYFYLQNRYYGNREWNTNNSFGSESSEQFANPEIYFPIQSNEYDKLNWFGFAYSGGRGRFQKNAPMFAIMEDRAMDKSEAMGELATRVAGVAVTSEAIGKKNVAYSVVNVTETGPQKTAPAQPIQIRKDFNETAFFFPQLATNAKGEIVIKFKAPEALTRWKMMGLAYTKDLKYGQIEKTLVTQKDLMIFTNPPRFLREGDNMEFSAKISNISESDLSGTAELHFFDALSMQPVDALLGIFNPQITFSANKGQSVPVSWKIIIPEGLQAVTYRITASAGAFSDGEEAALPVLTNRMLVTESLPLPVNGMQQKKFSFEKLVNSGGAGSTLRNYRLSLEYTSNPAWYAVQALPYLMEYPYECAEQLFSRYYANSLATHIANSDPKIKRVFESWKNISPDALKSNLEKNEELKSVLLQESPWVREANSESERKQRIALLFDLNRMASEQTSALKKLRDMQYENGGWPWFKGMPESRYITQHIVTGMGHLLYLDVLNLSGKGENYLMLKRAVSYLDETMNAEFEKLKKDDKDYLKNNHLGYEEIQYLFARTYFLADLPLGRELNGMVDYFKNQSLKFWNKQNNYMKAMIALYLNRFGDEKTPPLIMRSLKETALHNEETGMYWRNEARGWYWFEAPIETQAMMIEAFDEVSNDTKSVEDMKIWLLKQKQTQDWKTTKATTEAVYALLLRGTSLLASDKQVEITLGNEKVDPYRQDGSKPEAGTGYFKTSWDASAIKPEMGKVTVNNPNPTVAWGALYWQYFEQLDKITPAETPLSLNKKLFREINTPSGPVIEPVTENSHVKIGDKIVVRVELRTDRDMEYIHLKDMRASAFEPVNVLSGYRWQDGLGYYEATKDASTNFFIHFLPKGTYIFEYKLVATQKGDFSNGITSVQCMYAPEFSAHSEGIRVRVE